MGNPSKFEIKRPEGPVEICNPSHEFEMLQRGPWLIGFLVSLDRDEDGTENRIYIRMWEADRRDYDGDEGSQLWCAAMQIQHLLDAEHEDWMIFRVRSGENPDHYDIFTDLDEVVHVAFLERNEEHAGA